MQPPYARVTAYQGFLICEMLTSDDIEEEVAVVGPGRLGNVVMRTAANLAMSVEAIELFRTIKRGRDCIGDVNWFRTQDGKGSAFSWWGGFKELFKADQATACRDSLTFYSTDQLKQMCVVIPNDVPEGAMHAIHQLVESLPTVGTA